MCRSVFPRPRRKENNARLRFRDAQLDPALFLVEGLVGDDGEAEFLGIKIERPILIAPPEY